MAVARIVRPQGRRGEVLAEIMTDFPERFRELRRVFLERRESQPEPATLEDAWPHKGRIVLKFAGVESIGEAERLAGVHVLIPRAEGKPLPPDSYYTWELIGCRVVRETGGICHEVGVVTDVEATAGTSLLHVTRSNSQQDEVLIPLAKAICTVIDTKTKTIVIHPPDDLVELNAKPAR